MEIVWEWLNEHIENTDYFFPTMIMIVISSLLYKLILQEKAIFNRNVKATAIVSASGLILASYSFFAWHEIWLYILAGLLFAIPILTLLISRLNVNRVFKRVLVSADNNSMQFSEIIALALLDSMSMKWMTRKQLDRYNRYKLYILTRLGSLRTAKALLENLTSDKAYQYFMRYILEYSSGDMESAKQSIQKADDFQDKHTDPLVRVQIMLDHGVSYADSNNYQVADDYFRKAAEYYKNKKVKNSHLLFSIYRNYAINKLNMANPITGKPDETWKTISPTIEEYKSQLNLKKFYEQINLFNLKLDILRHIKAEREDVDKIVQEALSKIKSGNLPIENKLVFASSVSRIVWSSMLNPEPCLKFITENMEVFDSLDPESRYHALFNINLLFEELYGDLVADFIKLKDYAKDYFLHQAQSDLESWRNVLPNEAVYMRCTCLMELAGHQKKMPGYNYEKSLSYFYSSINLCHENHLYVNENLYRLAVIDELCAIENLDKNHEPKMADEMRSQCKAVEKFIPTLIQHPAISEFNLRLSFYYLILNEYDKCISHYVMFRENRVSLNHFAPWMHRYYMLTIYCVRMMYFYKTIEKIRKSKAMSSYDNDLRDWFESFPNHDGVLDSMLIAKFVGFGANKYPMKLKSWLPSNSEYTRQHAWFWFQELKLNIDITYGQFTDDERSGVVFFNADRHPFESHESLTIIKSMNDTGLASPCFITILSVEDLSHQQPELFDKLYDEVCSQIPKECPQIDELEQLYITTMLPVQAISS